MAESFAVTVTMGSLDAVTRPATDPPLRSFVTLGVPEMTPVLLLIVSPAGKPGALHVIGGVPPPESAAAKLQLYAVPAVEPSVTVPPGLEALQLGELV